MGSTLAPMARAMKSALRRISCQVSSRRKASTGTTQAAALWTSAVFHANAPKSSAFRPSCAKPNHVGVPTAPKETGTLFRMRQAIATRRAGNPRPTSNGAARAAGVPKPLAPSMRN